MSPSPSMDYLNPTSHFDEDQVRRCLFDPLELYKTLLSLDQSFKESITKPEELGLDSKQALLSLIEDRGDAVTSLYLAIKELKLENSDEFCYTLSSLIERSAKPQELGKEI